MSQDTRRDAGMHIQKEATEQQRSTQVCTKAGMRGSTRGTKRGRKKRNTNDDKRAHAELSCELVCVRALGSGEKGSKHMTRDGKGEVGEGEGGGTGEEQQRG